MSRYYCTDHPDVLELETRVLDVRPGAVLLAASPVFPGGGGQLMDRARIAWGSGEANVERVEIEPHGVWHVAAGAEAASGVVQVRVDAGFRALMCELHTVAHVVNALVFQKFEGALLTGAQLAADATLRIDFDLPGVENDRIKALEAPINEALRRDHRVRDYDMAWAAAEAVPGLFRAKSAAPPRGADGLVRIVAIGDLDAQACGGTHLTSTGAARAIRILKTENKGRQNRRVRVGLVGA